MITTILPTDQCNLDCSYCVSRKGNNVMSRKTLYNTIDFISNIHKLDNYNGRLEWHAAEPMMLPISFYEDAEKRIKYNNCHVEKAMCSNMTLADENWFKFLKKYNYVVSTSLDGDVYITDRVCGSGTFEKVIKSFMMMDKMDINYGVICVISKYTCEHADEIYPFFKCSMNDVKLNIETPNTFNKESTEALIKIFDDWFDDDNRITVDPFVHMVNFIQGNTFQKRCHIDCNKYVICVDTFGDVYPCESFVINADTSEYILGNVNRHTWQEIWYGNRRKAFLENQMVLSDDCMKCKYVEYCNGGCNADSMIYGPKNIRKASICGIVKPLMNHISKRLEVS